VPAGLLATQVCRWAEPAMRQVRDRDEPLRSSVAVLTLLRVRLTIDRVFCLGLPIQHLLSAGLLKCHHCPTKSVMRKVDWVLK